MSTNSPGEDRDPVDVLAEEFAERLRDGELPSISDYTARHPELADQLREVLPAVAQMEQLKRFRKATSIVEVKSAPSFTSLGDFRIVRELGRGGMGVVYEAVHESLGRSVALKVFPARGAQSAKLRDRFLREAQAAAKLHHTNIVPVFGVGEQDGVPYYVMQLIRGQGLNAIISGWKLVSSGTGFATPNLQNDPTTHIYGDDQPAMRNRVEAPTELTHTAPTRGDWSFIARIGAEAAEALQAAHDQGILHRDVKPGNLLVDGSGRVWVTDFGLAKMLDREGLTQTGDVLGTLPYMPPEAFHGTFDQRGDVYGLGATLYELLTLETPFTSDTPAGMIRQIDTRDPRSPRKTNPEVPRDLETIVLKALARDPRQRYASAGDLAEDLRAFLDDRPIQARRSTWVEQARRWTRRNPTITWLSATTATALLLAAAFGWAGYVRASKALASEAAQRKKVEESNTQIEEANDKLAEANDKLEANLTLSLEAFEKLFNASTQEGNGPGGFVFGDAADKVAVLETVLAFYDRFAEQNATNPNLQFQAGKANRRVGEMQVMLGRRDKGETAFRKAAVILEPLSVEFPESEPVLQELFLTYAHAPATLYGTGKQQWNASPLRRLWDDGKLAEDALKVPKLELGLRLAMVLEETGDTAAAEQIYRTILRTRKAAPPAQGHPFPFPELRTGMIARLHLSGLLLKTGRVDEAKRLLDPVGLEYIVESRGPMPRMIREMLAEQLEKLGDAMEKRGESTIAARLKKQSSTLLAARPQGLIGGMPGKEGPPEGAYPKGPFPKGMFPKGEYPTPPPFGPEFPPPFEAPPPRAPGEGPPPFPGEGPPPPKRMKT